MGWGIFVFLLATGVVYLALLILAWIFPVSGHVNKREGFLLLLLAAFLLAGAIWIVAAAFISGLPVSSTRPYF